ncbi:nucleophile aminohydrolase [Geopyxis carbonaria]|nr:nucleophile aminohydrolase [Geopyxis carbonaria]
MSATPPFTSHFSRRSVVHSVHGIVACTQPLAAQAGLQVLRAGGNAADAAVAVAAVLNVTEPTSTGIGGDLFCLYYSAAEEKVRGLNASGRAPAALTLERARSDLGAAAERIPADHAHGVTVPGAAAGWCDVAAKFGSGKFTMADLLADAIRHAEEGFPVSELAAKFWEDCAHVLKGAGPNWREMMKGDRAPRNGEVMRMPNLAKTFRIVAEQGARGFYEGPVAEAIVAAVKERGGVMEMEDLRAHLEKGSEEVEPIGIEFAGQKVWECAPNGQGVVALMALGILEALREKGVVGELGGGEEGWGHNQTEYLHAIIEALRIAFADGHWWITDPAVSDVPVSGLLDKDYLATRASLFSKSTTNASLTPGSPAQNQSDTVYFAVTDAFGNGCSFINSTFHGFGSGLIPLNHGFNLQNRGCGFSLNAAHPNVLAPQKRPYHTIIPGMLTSPDGSKLRGVFGVMGGFMQPQGHVQVLLNMLRCGMDPQRALDAPRVSVGMNYDPSVRVVHVEEGIDGATVVGLRAKGHNVEVVKGHKRGMFGRGQIILVREEEEEGEKGRRVYSAGSDMRGDGHAVGY